MAGISGRYDPASSIDHQGLLHNLQNWERSLLDEDKKFQAPDSGTRKKVSASENKVGNIERRVPAPELNKPASLVNNDSFQNRLSGVSDTISHLPGSLAPDDGSPFWDDFFYRGLSSLSGRNLRKQSIAIQGALPFLPQLWLLRTGLWHISNLKDAESDCTEALNLYNRYIKAYSRGPQPEKSLGNLRNLLKMQNLP